MKLPQFSLLAVMLAFFATAILCITVPPLFNQASLVRTSKWQMARQLSAIVEARSSKVLQHFLNSNKINEAWDGKFYEYPLRAVILRRDIGSIEKIRMLELLLNTGFDLNQTDGEGRTVLLEICEGEWNPIFDRPILRFLLKKGANVNVQGYFKQTPLHWMACHKDIEMYRLLLEYGAREDIFDFWQETPRDIAIKNNLKLP